MEMENKMIRVILAPSLELALSIENVVLSVEAEYGGDVVEGAVYTAAHHVEKYKKNPAPCNDKRIPVIQDGNVLVSHMDLDTVGGVLRAMPEFQDLFSFESSYFWGAAEYVDNNGPHRVTQHPARFFLAAYWAFAAQKPRLNPKAAHDVTEEVVEAGNFLRKVLAGDPDILKMGETFLDAKKTLNKESFRGFYGDIGIRSSKEFVASLYDYDNVMFKGLVSFNEKFETITVSLESPVPGFSCSDFVKTLWGQGAGGKDGVAGSPRGQKMDPSALMIVAQEFEKAISDYIVGK
jgi:hypothetical protein